jgi:hypothetical protein
MHSTPFQISAKCVYLLQGKLPDPQDNNTTGRGEFQAMVLSVAFVISGL